MCLSCESNWSEQMPLSNVKKNQACDFVGPICKIWRDSLMNLVCNFSSGAWCSLNYEQGQYAEWILGMIMCKIKEMQSLTKRISKHDKKLKSTIDISEILIQKS